MGGVFAPGVGPRVLPFRIFGDISLSRSLRRLATQPALFSIRLFLVASLFFNIVFYCVLNIAAKLT